MVDEGKGRAMILESIRRSLAAAGGGPGLVEALPAEAIAAEYAAIPRSYSRSGNLAGDALVQLFAERLREYDTGVFHADESSIAMKIAEILELRRKCRMAIPEGLPASWLPPGFAFEDAQSFDKLRLDTLEGLLSGCTAAIAETGTLVLQNAAGQGPRILSLVPDYHLCVVFSGQIVATVPEAFERLENSSVLPTTFISGPSATADIEMTRIKGVHGPRFLDVLIVDRVA